MDIHFLYNLINSCDEEPISVHKLLECEPDWVTRPPDPDRLQHPRVPQLAAAKLTVKYLRNNQCDVCDLYFDLRVSTFGFLNSFGFTHRTKKGLHCPKVAMSKSRDFLN